MLGFVYILEDENGMYYIGSCKDIDARFRVHLSGRVHTTARMKNPKIVMIQEYANVEEAEKIERRLKKLKRKDYIEKIIREGKIKMEL